MEFEEQKINKDFWEIWSTILLIDNALVQRDAGLLDDLLTADFIGSVPTGASFSKKAYLKHHCESPFGLTSIDENQHSSTVRQYGNIAIVNRRVLANLQLPTGMIISYAVQRMEVLTKLNNKWLMTGGQGTRVMTDKQPA